MAWQVFYSYAHKDEALRDRLADALAPLRQKGSLTEWHDRKIQPGVDWDAEICSRIDTADLVLALISPDFLASNYCFGTEMERAFARVKSGHLRFAPVLVRPCLWEESRFSALQMIPRDGLAATSWPSMDEAMKAIGLEIRDLVSQPKPVPPPPDAGAEAEPVFRQSLDLVRQQVRAYARRYEQTRQRMPASGERTAQMEAIFQSLRQLATASYPLLDELAASPSPGERLAAVSILQVFASEAHLPLLVALLGREKPFVGYHAARALRFAVGSLTAASHPALADALTEAKQRLKTAVPGFDSDRARELSLASEELAQLSRPAER